MLCAAVLIALAAVAELLLSYHADWPTSPSIVLNLGLVYAVSMLLTPHGLLRHQRPPSTHLKA